MDKVIVATGQTVVLTRRHELLSFVEAAKKAGQSIGFVPTMGALHAGHRRLLEKAVAENDCAILSIFVNPKQFGPSEDFSKYPRTLNDDVNLAKSAKVHAVFAPNVSEMYPEGFFTSVKVANLGEAMCGAFRPGHFDGVTTVVLLFLNLMGATRAYFGTKDFQQLAIIKKMCADLAHPTEIVGVETVRERDGLALSSRNRFLDEKARERAKSIPLALAAAAKAFLEGERDVKKILEKCLLKLSESQLSPQYLELRDATDLRSIEGTLLLTAPKNAVLAIAQFVENADQNSKTRLIDNIVLSDHDTEVRARLEDFIKLVGLSS